MCDSHRCSKKTTHTFWPKFMSWGIWPICCSVSFQGRCECRRDMKWNNEAQECQVCKFLIFKYYEYPTTSFLTLKIFMDVDCSTITYETPPSSAVLSAVEKAKAELASVASNLTQETLERWRQLVFVKSWSAPPRTQTKEESLANSLLKQIDPKNSTADQIKEAFCRDIDAFSFEFSVKL